MVSVLDQQSSYSENTNTHTYTDGKNTLNKAFLSNFTFTENFLKTRFSEILRF